MSIESNFESAWKLNPSTGCWDWQRSKTPRGYGKLAVQGRLVAAHRHSYSLSKGSIHPGSHVLHKCDNRSCVNPEHLFLGTHKDNMVDMTTKGRSGKAKISPEQVVIARRLAAQGHQRAVIAQMTGISYTNLCYILRGNTWTGVAA